MSTDTFSASSFAPIDTAAFRGEVKSDPGYKNVTEFLNLKRESSVHTAFADVLSASTGESLSSSPAIRAANVIHLSISQHPQDFASFSADKTTLAAVNQLEWINFKAYLIVGLLVTEEVT